MRVVLVDDNDLMRESLENALRSRSIAVAWSPDGALGVEELIAQGREHAHEVDAAVIDLKLPPAYSDGGIRLATALRNINPDIGIIILSAYEKELRLIFARRVLSEIPGRGGVGYLFKDRISRDVLRDAVLRVCGGGTVVDPEFAAEVARRGRETFDPSEIEVLDLMTRGYTNAEIAKTLHLAEVTIEKRFTAAHRKLIQGAEADGLAGGAAPRNRRVVTVIEWLRRQGRLD